MLATRWQPFTSLWSEFSRLHDEVNRAFEPRRYDASWPGFAVAFPAVNVWEDEENVYLEAELPGMGPDDVEIYVTGGNELTLKGQRKLPEGEGVWHRRERGFGSFTRALTLPRDVDADRVEASFNAGVMTIKLPKAEAARPRRITVKGE